MINILILEDETESSNHLKKLLNEYEDISILTIIKSIQEAIVWLNENKSPDLIFMDVQLIDGDSFLIFDKHKIECPVVFITAYNEYAIKAIKLSSIDYLLKPVSKLDLSKTLIRFYSKQLSTYKSIKADDLQLLKNDYKKRFLVKEGNQYLPVKTDEIAYAYWTDYAFIRRFDGKSFIVNYSVNQLEEILPPHLFVRINRQVLANINSIESLYKEGKTFYINLLPKFFEHIKISKDSYTNLKRILS